MHQAMYRTLVLVSHVVTFSTTREDMARVVMQIPQQSKPRKLRPGCNSPLNLPNFSETPSWSCAICTQQLPHGHIGGAGDVCWAPRLYPLSQPITRAIKQSRQASARGSVVRHGVHCVLGPSSWACGTRIHNTHALGEHAAAPIAAVTRSFSGSGGLRPLACPLQRHSCTPNRFAHALAHVYTAATRRHPPPHSRARTAALDALPRESYLNYCTLSTI